MVQLLWQALLWQQPLLLWLQPLLPPYTTTTSTWAPPMPLSMQPLHLSNQ